jgi:hypothetical protein
VSNIFKPVTPPQVWLIQEKKSGKMTEDYFRTAEKISLLFGKGDAKTQKALY